MTNPLHWIKTWYARRARSARNEFEEMNLGHELREVVTAAVRHTTHRRG